MEDSIIANSIKDEVSSDTVLNIDVKACFLNVCSMFSSTAIDLDHPEKVDTRADNRINKHSYFHHRLTLHEYDIAIFAETRTVARARIYSEYVIFSSGCSDCSARALGIDIWIARSFSLKVVAPVC